MRRFAVPAAIEAVREAQDDERRERQPEHSKPSNQLTPSCSGLETHRPSRTVTLRSSGRCRLYRRRSRMSHARVRPRDIVISRVWRANSCKSSSPQLCSADTRQSQSTVLLGTMLDPPVLLKCARRHAESVTVVTLSRVLAAPDNSKWRYPHADSAQSSDRPAGAGLSSQWERLDSNQRRHHPVRAGLRCNRFCQALQ